MELSNTRSQCIRMGADKEDGEYDCASVIRVGVVSEQRCAAKFKLRRESPSAMTSLRDHRRRHNNKKHVNTNYRNCRRLLLSKAVFDVYSEEEAGHTIIFISLSLYDRLPAFSPIILLSTQFSS